MIKEDIDKNLENITRIIKRANITKNFALVFAECNSLEKQEKYVGELHQRCHQEGIVLTEVKLLDRPPVIRLFNEIKEHLEKKFGDDLPEKLGIQVTGLELSILLDEDEQAPAVLQILNMNREKYYNDLPFPFVFWLPKYACIKVANAAQDFWAYRVGTPTFCHDEITGPSLPENMEEGKDITVWQDKAAQIPVLERLINTRPLTEVLVNLLIKSGEAYAYIGSTEKARQKYEQAIEENKKNNGDPQWSAEAYNKLGIIYSDMGEGKEYLEKAVKSLEKYLEIVGPTGRTDRLTRGYNHLGLVYDRHKRYNQAIESYERALQISRNYGYRKEEGDILGNIGLLYRKQKKFDDALKMHQQALTISRELDDIQSEALDLSNIGLIYYEQNAYKDTVDYFNKALFLNVKTGNKLEEMKQLILLGDTWKALGDFSTAREKYLSAKGIAHDINIGVFTVFDRLAALFTPGTDDDSTVEIRLLKEAIENSQRLNKADRELYYWEKLGDIYRRRNEITEKNNCLMLMEGILRKQLQHPENEDEERAHYEALAKIYDELGKKKELKTIKHKLEELNYRQFIVWNDTGTVEMEDGQPVLLVGKTYDLNFQIVRQPSQLPLIFQKKITIFKKVQKMLNVDRFSFENRRLSEEKKRLPDEKSDEILQEKNTSEQNYLLPIEQQKKTNKVRSPSPPPYNMPEPLTPAVSFRFKSSKISFDRSTINLLLSENNISDIGSVVIKPTSNGNHRVSVSIRVKASGHKNNFEIPIRALPQIIKKRKRAAISKKGIKKGEMEIEDLIAETIPQWLSYLLIRAGKIVGEPKNILAPPDELNGFAMSARLSSVLLNKFPELHRDLKKQKVYSITMHDKSGEKIVLLKQLQDNYSIVFECIQNELNDVKKSIEELDKKLGKEGSKK